MKLNLQTNLVRKVKEKENRENKSKECPRYLAEKLLLDLSDFSLTPCSRKLGTHVHANVKFIWFYLRHSFSDTIFSTFFSLVSTSKGFSKT
jgi:hypothetical protein